MSNIATPNLYEYELVKSADVMCRELFKLKPGETCVITADTESDWRVIDSVAGAVFACDAKPMVIKIASPLGVGKAADPMLPIEALTGALLATDVWMDFNNQWLLYSTPFDKAFEGNKKLRYQCLVGMNVDMMVRCIGRVDFPALKEFIDTLTKISKEGKHFRVTTPAGVNLEFDNSDDPMREVFGNSGYADVPGAHMVGGQIGWSPELGTINGTIVFDGTIDPPCGLVEEPVRLTVEKGAVVKIEGGKEAKQFEAWLKSFNDPQMFRLAHICYGFHPGAKLSGNVVEDERVWGCTEWGLGNVGPMLIPPDGIPGASHTDGTCLNSSVWIDGVQIVDEGKVVNPKLAELAKKLGKS